MGRAKRCMLPCFLKSRVNSLSKKKIAMTLLILTLIVFLQSADSPDSKDLFAIL